MSFKDLLVPLTSFPHPTSVEAIDQAIGFAEIFGAHIAGITFEVEIPRPPPATPRRPRPPPSRPWDQPPARGYLPSASPSRSPHLSYECRPGPAALPGVGSGQRDVVKPRVRIGHARRLSRGLSDH